MTPEEIARVETLVNGQIAAARPVYVKEVEEARARQINTLRAVFGEKYPDVVRVVSVGADIDAMLNDPQNPQWMQYPVEFCGGTHLSNSAEAGRFALLAEEGVAKGIRRVVGITGDAARRAEEAGQALLDQTASLRDKQAQEIPAALVSLQRDVIESAIPLRIRHALQKQIAELQRIVKESQKTQAAASGEAVMDRAAELLAAAETMDAVTVVIGDVPAARPEALRSAIDWIRNKTHASAVVLAATDKDKVTLIAGMSKGAVARGLKAGDLIREIAPIVGGRGGGRPDMAQGGGDNPGAVSAALDRGRQWIRSALTQK
jgi:alanyl-tRNA synthetase